MIEENDKIKMRVKYFTSTKGTKLEEVVNKWLDELDNDENAYVGPIDTSISFTGQYGYMICTTIIYYIKEETNEVDVTSIDNIMDSVLSPGLEF